jgi:hypothetical protein
MPVFTGNAESHTDLLNKLKVAIADTLTPSGDRWIVQRYTTTAGIEELILKGVGTGGTDQIYVGLKAYHDAQTDNYGLILNGYTGFNNSLGFYEQPGAMLIPDLPPCLPSVKSNPVNANAIQYWITANSESFRIVTRTGTVYHQAYIGFYLTYGTPPQYPYRLIIGGSGVVNKDGVPSKQNDVSTTTHCFWKPIDVFNGTTYNVHVGSLAVKEPGGAWKRPYLSTSGTGQSACSGTFPYVEDTRGYLGGMGNLRPNIDGSYPMQSIVIVDGAPANMYGEFTGMKHTTGFNLSSEDVVTYAGDNYLAVQNVFRTSDSDMVLYRLV